METLGAALLFMLLLRGSPSSLGLLGWTKDSVQPGDVVTVYIYQSKTGRPVGRLNRIVLADGTALKDSALGYREQ